MSISRTSRGTLNEPADEIDLEAWLFGLSDADYQACARGHRGAGVFTDEQGRGMINVESIGGNLIVQHYRLRPSGPLVRRDVLAREPGLPVPPRPRRRRRAMDARGDTAERRRPSDLACTVEVDLPPVLALLARLSLLGHFLGRHVDEEARGFAADIARKRPAPEPASAEKARMVHVHKRRGRVVDLFTSDELAPRPTEFALRNGMPGTIAGWKALADGLLTNQSCVFHRNLEISSCYAWMYKLLPECFKWAGMAAFASYHVRLALLPFRLDTDRTGYVDIPQSLERRPHPGGRLAEDVDTVRTTNNAIFDDIFWVHLAYRSTPRRDRTSTRSPGSGSTLCRPPRRLRGD